ncbi:MAG: lamin tail domain-containing protein [Myxococcales bacterium]|nr:lamin tail domain-containing protein [Myxococcales bacterium]
MRKIGVLFGCLGCSFAVLPHLWAACLQPPGDLDSSGTATVIDVQCLILTNLWSLTGQIGAPPTCLKVPGSPLVVADHNCDGIVNVTDTIIGISFALAAALAPELDANSNQCVDVCETDSDGDGTFDPLDCAPANSQVFSGAAEICNGWDDNCNGLVDETAAASVAQSCNDTTICNGIETCAVLPAVQQLRLGEVMIDPVATVDTLGEWVEILNPTVTAIDIRGFALATDQGQNHIVDPGGALFVPANGRVVLAAVTDKSQNGGVFAAYGWVGLTLDNGAGSVILKNKQGEQVDRLDYGPAVGIPVPAGASLARIRPDFPSDSPSSWTPSTAMFGAGDKGTPAGPNLDVALGVCNKGVTLICNDGSSCTTDTCDPVLGCVFVPNTEPCDDGDDCTAVDLCQGGSCIGTGKLTCDDGNPCTDDLCLPGLGCTFAPNTVVCTDTIGCTVGDSCADGVCVGKPNTEFCEDGLVCTLNLCDPGSPSADEWGCTTDPAALFTTLCEDGDACTFPDVCGFDGTCKSGFEVECNDNDVCTVDSCEPPGGCVHVGALAFALQCDDDDPCTFPDVCDFFGNCVAGFPLECDDSDPCTDEFCDTDGQCVYATNTAPCDDGVGCTAADTCSGGVCGGAVSDGLCDDGNPCTIDTCAPNSSASVDSGCVHDAPAAFTTLCDDDDECTFPDVCNFFGDCIPGFPACVCGDGKLDAEEECDDGNPTLGDGCTPDCILEPCYPDTPYTPFVAEVCNGADDDCDAAIDEGCVTCGAQLWARTTVVSGGSPAADDLTAVAVTHDGVIYRVGTTTDLLGVNGIVEQLLPTGDSVWKITLTADLPGEQVRLFGAAATANGDVVVVGSRGTVANPDILLARLAAFDGAVVWTQSMGGAEADRGWAVGVSGDDTVAATGYLTNQGQHDTWLGVVDGTTGAIVVNTLLNPHPGLHDEGTTMGWSQAGDLVTAGWGPGVGGVRGRIFRTDAATGAILAQTTFDNEQWPNQVLGMTALNSSEWFVVGTALPPNGTGKSWAGVVDPTTFALTTSWTWGGEGGETEQINAVSPSASGKVVMAGQRQFGPNVQAWVASVDPQSGAIGWESTIKRSRATSMTTDPADQVIVGFVSDYDEETLDTYAVLRKYAKDCTAPQSSKVVKVFLLAGQSNADGYGFISQLPQDLATPQLDVQMFWHSNGVLTPLGPASTAAGRFGPEIQMGRDLQDGSPKETTLIIKYAVGGTNLYSQWYPGQFPGDPATGPLYKVFLQTITNAKAAIQNNGGVVQLEGMAWMQGESDGFGLDVANAYETNLTLFIERVRQDISAPTLPFVIGEIYAPTVPYRLIIRAAQETVAQNLPNTYIVDTDDLSLTDSIHYGTEGQLTLGARFASQLLHIMAEEIP